MTTKMPSLRNFRNPIGCLILLAALGAAAGCSTAESPGGSGTNMNHVLPSGSSVSGWVVVPSGGTHASTATLDYIASNGSSGCTQCHGSDLKGGISGVSCFGNTTGCHHGPVANWKTSAVHGATAKKAPGSSGFASCQICHGNNFTGGGSKVSCYTSTCHGVSAPHAPKPWRGSLYTHTDTDPANAPVCAQCHYLGSPNNPPNHPSTPAAAGTPPGCFNNTLCHSEGTAPHALGATWTAPTTSQFHGLTAKQNLSYCQGCHGTPGTTLFNGGSAPTSCQASCHAQAKAHPIRWYQAPQPFPGYVSSHRDSGNQTVACAICHKVDGAGTGQDPNAPSCFSASFNGVNCHSGGPGSAPHTLGATWLNPATGGSSFHGTTAKADLLYCQTCHGTPPRGFGGGTAPTACTTCHAKPEAHPTDWQGVRAISTASITHRTSANRTAACGVCHKTTGTGAGPNPSAPSCFSASYTNGDGQNRACHSGGPGQPNHSVPFFDNTVHTQATIASFTSNCGSCHAVTGTSPVSGAPLCTSCHTSDPRGVTNCTSCHVNPPSGTPAAYPNVAGAHKKHLDLAPLGNTITCNTCHNGLGTNTLNHYNRAKSRVPPGDVAFVAPFPYTTGTATFDNSLTSPTALSCGSVSCHGAQTTPGWRTTGTTCTACHKRSGTSAGGAPATYYNDYTETWFPHDFHLGETGGSCDTCHGMTVATHFGSFGDKAIASRAAAGTILPSFNYPTSPPPGGADMGNCTTGCH
jgi:hypothetical protein